MRRVITPWELRADPRLVRELRAAPDQFVERRTAGAFEVRAADDAGWKGGGFGIVYDSRSENLGGFVEIIKPGAARDVLAREPDVRALFNHDPNYVLGRTAAGTLRLEERGEGVEYEFDAPDTTYARDLRELFDRGDVTQSSFAFRTAPDAVEWDEDPDTGLLLRVVHRFSALYDMSPVTYPAYPTATSGARSTEDVEHTAPAGREDERAGEADDAAEIEAAKEQARAAYEARQRRARLRSRLL